MTMSWQQLLSPRRLHWNGSFRESQPQSPRTPAERDWDRILFSTAFRRMHDKTQVFPLPDNDFVHSRLTHSLEVSSVGRSLGRYVGILLAERHAERVPNANPHELGNIVASACLAHDIGNPPFGHAGEKAIAAFFRSSEGEGTLSELTAHQKVDFQDFEGNAQGFRILTRLLVEYEGGLQLTAATLGAFTKYPRRSGRELKLSGQCATKKHGFFQEDAIAFRALAAELELPPLPGETDRWARHPLAFLVEAADDICYSLLDIEDGARLRHLSYQEAEDKLTVVARKHTQFNNTRATTPSNPMDRIAYLRALAIGRLIDECAQLFVDSETSLLAGTLGSSLITDIPSCADLQTLKDTAFQRCYEAVEVLEIELAGFQALGGLLSRFVPAALATTKGDSNDQERRACALLRESGVHLSYTDPYHDILRITDYVSGMTDRHALATFRRLTGIAIPGRIS